MTGLYRGVVAGVLLAAFAAETPAPARAARPVRGSSIRLEAAGRLHWQEMLRAEAQARRAGATAPPLRPEVVPIMPPPPGRELRLSGAARRGRGGRSAAAFSSAPFVPAPGAPAISEGFAALGDNNTRIPPDTMGAVGPAHLVSMLNTQVRVQDKSGGVLGTVSLSTFWTAPPSTLSGNPFDPRIAYDSHAGRWIAVVAANAASASSAVWLAVSETSDPTGAWRFFSIKADTAPAPATWADFPTLGFNQTWIAVTANMFTIASSGFSGAKMWVVDKASALAPSPTLAVTVFPSGFDETTISLGPPPTPSLSFQSFTLQPALTFGDEEKLYLVDSPLLTLVGDDGTAKLLRLSEITGTGSSPLWSPTAGSPFVDTQPTPASTGLFSAGVDFNTSQIGGEQLDLPSTCSGGPLDGQACSTSSNCIPPPPTPTPIPPGGACRRVDTGDPRLQNAVFRNGAVWTTHSAGLPAGGATDRTAVFWYQLDPAALGSGAVVQSGVIDGGAGVHHAYPSLSVNRDDDACVGFSRSRAAAFIEAVVSGRLGTDPPGMLDPISVLKAGEGPYFKTGAATRNRWGDYSFTSVDPADDTTIWTIQQYAAAPVTPTPGSSAHRWGTWWGKKVKPTVTPTASETGTATGTPTPTPTFSATPTLTASPSATGTPTESASPTITPTPSVTATPTPTAPADLSGRVFYYRDARPVPGVTVNAIGAPPQSTVSNAAGDYAFAEVLADSLSLRPEKLGDFGAGISSLDAAFASQRAVGQRTFDTFQELACDVTGNGSVGSLDVARIRQLRLGILARFEVAVACGSDWLFLPVPLLLPGQDASAPQIGGGACQLGSISYTPLAPPAGGQDFIAILFGDCTGNWQPGQDSP